MQKDEEFVEKRSEGYAKSKFLSHNEIFFRIFILKNQFIDQKRLNDMRRTSFCEIFEEGV